MSALLWLKTCSKNGSRRQSKRPYTFHREFPSKSESGRCENEAFVQDFPSKKSESWRCKNEAFVRDVPQNLNIEDVKTMLSREASLNILTLKMWKSFSCETSLNMPQFLKVEAVKMTPALSFPLRGRFGPKRMCSATVFCNRPPDKLPHPSSGTRFVFQNAAFRASALSRRCISCETSLKIWKWKMRKRSFCARLSLKIKSESWRCKNEAFVRDFPQNLKVEDTKTKLRARLPSWLWDLLGSLGCEIFWLWDLLAVRSLGCEISWLWRSDIHFTSIANRNTEVRPSNRNDIVIVVMVWSWWCCESGDIVIVVIVVVIMIVVMSWKWWYCDSGDIVIMVILW